MSGKHKPLVTIQTYEDRHSNFTEDRSSSALKEANQTNNFSKVKPYVGNNPSDIAPPPPPLPLGEKRNDVTTPNKTAVNKPKAPPPPPPVKTSTLSYYQAPPCPTPDYDTLSVSSSTASRGSTLTRKPASAKTSQNSNNDRVEMDSLDSFKLNQPNDNIPKPPSTYFSKRQLSGQLSNGSVTSKTSTLTKTRPVSVVIREYPSGTLRPAPRKLDFLGQNGTDRVDGKMNGQQQQLVEQFASELSQTLSRSNLRKKTESVDDLLDFTSIKPQSNGSVRISLNHRNLAKSTSDLSEITKAFANRVTINVQQTEKPGILKSNGHKPVVHQKSITFGDKPTVINETLLKSS